MKMRARRSLLTDCGVVEDRPIGSRTVLSLFRQRLNPIDPTLNASNTGLVFREPAVGVFEVAVQSLLTSGKGARKTEEKYHLPSPRRGKKKTVFLTGWPNISTLEGSCELSSWPLHRVPRPLFRHEFGVKFPRDIMPLSSLLPSCSPPRGEKERRKGGKEEECIVPV